MIRHVFKLIWNRKRRNALMIVEIALSFVVLFAIGGMTLYGLSSYNKPLGFDHENVWILSVSYNNNEDALFETLDQIQRALADRPEVVHVSPTSSNYPYSLETWYTGWTDEATGERFQATPFYVGDEFASVMNISIAEGRWFSDDDDASRLIPIVINQELRKERFGDKAAVGQDIFDTWTIVGVTSDYRHYGELDEPDRCFFVRNNLYGKETSSFRHFAISVNDDADHQGMLRTERDIQEVARNWTVGIQTLSELRDFYFGTKKLPIYILGVIAAFLVLNVALGLFGVMWYSISRRRPEIGLRRAIGATAPNISNQILGEALAVTTFGVVLGGLAAVQAPLLGLFAYVEGTVYTLAFVAAATIIFVIVGFCAVYPSRLAAGILPAVALHDD